jgi:hypothetical protein
VDPVLGNGSEISNLQQPLLNNGFANMHVFSATIALLKRNGIFFEVRGELL